MQKNIRWSNLFALAACLLGLFLLSTCGPIVPLPTSTNITVAVTLTPTTPQPTIMPTSHSRIIPTLTRTQMPTRTAQPTQIPTNTLYPTALPATPQANAENYQLTEWSLQSAAELVALAESNLPIEPVEFDTEKYLQYTSDFQDAAATLSLSYQEALLRAPTDSLSSNWQSRLVYAQVVDSDTLAGDTLINYLTGQLSSEKMSFETLETWISLHFNKPPGFPFELASNLIKVRLPSPFTAGYLLYSTNGGIGAICAVLAKDQVSYYGYTLISSFKFEQSVGVHNEVRCEVEDLTGDGIDEVIIVTEWGGRLVNQSIIVYSLDQWPPRRLELDPEIAHTNGDSWPSRYYFSGIDSEASPKRLNLLLWPSSWDCWIYADSHYKWNGLWLAQEKYGPADGDHYTDPGCAESLYLPLTPLKLRPVLLEKFLKAQPGSDLLRYQLGIQRALLGDTVGAVQMLESLLAEPTDPQSEWVQKAHRFLMAYTSPDQIYTSCRSVSDCALGEGLVALAQQIPPEMLLSAPDRMKSAGIPILKSGSLPGSAALWFTLRFPGSSYPELWLLA